MTRIDHAASAQAFLRSADGQTPDGATAYATCAQAEAVLALVEQQQIASLIEMAQSPLFNAFDGSNPALDALMEKTCGVAPDIAAALGIGDGDE
jgi:uncharacterized ParB-like nuclease family protein